MTPPNLRDPTMEEYLRAIEPTWRCPECASRFECAPDCPVYEHRMGRPSPLDPDPWRARR